MKDKNIQNIDDFIKGKIDSSTLPFEEAAWEMMEAKLDASSQARKIKKGIFNYARFLKFLIPAIIIGASITLLYTLSENKKSNSKTSEVINETQSLQLQTKLKKTVEKAGNLTSDSLNGNLGGSQQQQQQQQQQNKSERVAANNYRTTSKANFSDSNTADEGAKVFSNASKIDGQHKSLTMNDGAPEVLPSSSETISESNSKAEITAGDITNNTLSSNSSLSNTNSEPAKLQDKSVAQNDRSLGLTTISLLPQLDQEVAWIRTEQLIAANPILTKPFKKVKRIYAGIGKIAWHTGDQLVNKKPFSYFYLGYNWKRINGISLGFELDYARIPVSDYYSVVNVNSERDLLVSATNKRESFDIISTQSWFTNSRRFGLKTRLGLGLTYHSIFLESIYATSSGSLLEPLFTNSNTIYTKPDPHLTLGIQLNYKLVSDFCSLNIPYNHQQNYKSRRVINGEIQGYKINPAENQAIYDNVESTLVENRALGIFNVGLEFLLL